MWTAFVVHQPPGVNHSDCFIQSHELFVGQTLVAETTVEALHEVVSGAKAEMTKSNENDQNWSNFYSTERRFLYPTELVVRTFLAAYPRLKFVKPQPGQTALDVGCGDGRNTRLLCEMGLNVSGVEVTDQLAEVTSQRLAQLGHTADIRRGRNSALPFSDNTFDYLLASAVCYYCDEGETIHDNLCEYSRVTKEGGYIVASVANSSSYIFNDAEPLPDGTWRIKRHPYGCRNGYRLAGFPDEKTAAETFSQYFDDVCYGSTQNDYYGIDERLFWLVGKKPVRDSE